MTRIKNKEQIKNNKIENSNSSTSIFTLFSKEKHEVNWYVHRNKSIRNQLKKLWGNGPEDKTDLASMTIGQATMTKVNALFRALEKNGPCLPKDMPFNVILDVKHGACNNPQTKCVSKGFYHTHVTDNNYSYLVLWECFEDKKLINIVAIGQHENFDFKQSSHKPLSGMLSAMEAAKKANFDCAKTFDAENYNNQIYAK